MTVDARVTAQGMRLPTPATLSRLPPVRAVQTPATLSRLLPVRAMQVATWKIGALVVLLRSASARSTSRCGSRSAR